MIFFVLVLLFLFETENPGILIFEEFGLLSLTYVVLLDKISDFSTMEIMEETTVVLSVVLETVVTLKVLWWYISNIKNIKMVN